jgi:hypothetical protein
MQSFRWIRVATLLALALAATVAWPGGTGIAAQGQPVIEVLPSSSLVGVGQTTVVQVRVEGVAGLYGLDIRLSFDPSVVQVVDADDNKAGVQVGAGDLLKADFLIRNTADNSQGTVWYAVTQLNPTAEVEGGGTAFSVTFTGVQTAASSPIQLTYAKLAGRSGETLSNVTVDGEIQVVSAGDVSSAPTTAPSDLPSATPPSLPTRASTQGPDGQTPGAATRPAGTPAQPGAGTSAATLQPVAPGATPPATQAPGAGSIGGALSPNPTSPSQPSARSGNSGNELSVPLILAGMAGVLVLAGIAFAVWLLRARP